MAERAEIKNRIIKMELVDWKKLKWIQTSLKEISEEAREKLKRSLVANDFSMPFHIWENKKDQWILDGHHRQNIMKELEEAGVKIPKLLPGIFVMCKNKKEAAKLVLVYSSIYAGVTSEGLIEFLKENDLDWNELREELDIPDINLDYYFGEPDPLPNVEGADGQKSECAEYMIVTFKTDDKFFEVKQKLGLKGLVRTIGFDDLVEKWNF